MDKAGRWRATRAFAIAAIVAGLALAGVTMYLESEPGALPLAIVLAGCVGYGISLRLARRS